MKKVFPVAIVMAAVFAPATAGAGERVNEMALGAASGALVAGPVGLVAGGVIGYVAGPDIIVGALMLKCPTTGREFSTGIFADEETFQHLPDTVTKAVCPHCGRLHSWWTREARLTDTIVPERRSA